MADLAPVGNVQFVRGGKRQFLELDEETKFKMSGHSVRICRHFSKSAQIKIDVFPHEKRVHCRFGPFSASFDKRSQDPSLSAERRMRAPNRCKSVMVALRAVFRTRKRGSMIILIFHRV